MRETEMTANSTTQDDWGLWGERLLEEVLSELRSRGSKGEQGALGWGSWRRKPLCKAEMGCAFQVSNVIQYAKAVCMWEGRGAGWLERKREAGAGWRQTS